MRRINIFYITTALLGILLFVLLKPQSVHDISFFGFVENQETEINYNYPVVVERIYVTPGQEVHAKDTLALLYRQERKETLPDQDYKIATLRAEEALWLERKQNEVRELQLEKLNKIGQLNTEIDELTKKLDFKSSIVTQLQSITVDSSIYTPMLDEITHLEEQKELTNSNYEALITGLRQEIRRGLNPYASKIELLEAEQRFEEDQKRQKIAVLSPSDGLIGTISCKEEEHVPSFNTLLTFYEPHSGIVKGYVHEDLTLQVNIGDQYDVSSLKDAGVIYNGTVMGLGSRIVEIPSRLRKVPTLKSYGREVLVEIAKENEFLQKEKVGLRYVPDVN